MITNRYPLWKYLLILAVIVLGFIYALPNIYGDYPAVQITGSNAAVAVDESTIASVKTALQQANVSYQDLEHEGPFLMLRFSSTDAQLKAKEVIQQAGESIRFGHEDLVFPC